MAHLIRYSKAYLLVILLICPIGYVANGQTTDITGTILREVTGDPIEDTVHFQMLNRQDITFDGFSDVSGIYYLYDVPTDATTGLNEVMGDYKGKTLIEYNGSEVTFKIYTEKDLRDAAIITLDGNIVAKLKGMREGICYTYKWSPSGSMKGLFLFTNGHPGHTQRFVIVNNRLMGEINRDKKNNPQKKGKGLTTSYIVTSDHEGFVNYRDTIELDHDVMNEVTHYLSPELAADGYFRAVIRQDGGSYPPGKIVYRGLNVAYSDSATITSPPYVDMSGVPIPSGDGFALVERNITPTTTPFVAKIDTVQIISGDNGVMYHDVESVPPLPQVEQIGGKVRLLLTGGQVGDGVDVVWKLQDGTVIDSVRTDINGDYLFKQVPTETDGYLYVRFPGTDATRRDTAYYKQSSAPLNTLDVIVNEDDTLRTNHNITLIPKWIVDPYTGAPVRTEIDDIEELEGGRINSELALYGEENIYLDFDSHADTVWFNNYRTLAVDVMGYDGHHYVSTPREITLQMQNDYDLRDATKKHLYGRNMSIDGVSGDKTTPKSATDEEFSLHIGYIINFSGDQLGAFKEDYFRTMDFGAVNPANRISVMNPDKPQSITIPTAKDRVYHTLFRKQRERLINGTAFYRLDYLEE